MKRKLTSFLALLPMSILAAVLLSPGLGRAADRPNVLLILADDLGYADVGIQGQKAVATPHIDSIAQNGVRFSSGYVSGTMCSPTRAGLMTGRYQTRFGHEFNPAALKDGLPAGEVTFADRMKAAGYVTGLVGKWHLGEVEYAEFHPLDRGFSESVYFPGQKKLPPLTVWRGRESETINEFIGPALAREANAFITRHQDELWFLYLAPTFVHKPIEVTAGLLARVPASAGDDKHRAYLASIIALDDLVGAVLAKLRELNLEQRTLIFFLSDNGGTVLANNLPLRGGKGQTFEGGIRIPFLAQWKGVIPAGRVLDQPVISLDLLPTALAVAGVAPKPEWNLDGANLLPLLKGEDTLPHPEGLFWRFGDQWAVRIGDWKLVQSGSRKLGPVALHDLAQDVGEKTNLIQSHPEKERELRSAWERWNSSNVAPLWPQPSEEPAHRPGDASKIEKPDSNP